MVERGAAKTCAWPVHTALLSLKPDLDQGAEIITNSRDTITKPNKSSVASRHVLYYIVTSGRAAYSTRPGGGDGGGGNCGGSYM